MTKPALRRAAALLLPALLLPTTGCTASRPVDATATVAASQAVPDPTASITPTAVASSPSTTTRFGRTATFSDGLALTVTDAGAFTPSRYASKAPAKSYRKFRITVANRTDQVFDPALVAVTMQDGDRTATSVVDVANGVGGVLSAAVPAGRTVRWTIGYGVNGGRLVLDVALNDAGRHEAMFSR